MSKTVMRKKILITLSQYIRQLPPFALVGVSHNAKNGDVFFPEALIKQMMATQGEEGDDVQKMAEEALEKGGPKGLTDFATKKLNEWKSQPVSIAVVGQSGAGKSSFINTIRGIDDEDDELFAPVGVVECTTEKKSYPFPDNPLILMWDLPGAGTEKFKAADYAKNMKFKTYDAFVILSSVRFTEIDQNIAKEVQKLGKPFFFARTKMDNAIRDDQRKKKKNFNPSSTADQIREDCLNKLGDEHKEKIFLISNLLEDELTKFSSDYGGIQFDNEALTTAMVEGLPEIQKQALGKLGKEKFFKTLHSFPIT